MPCTVFLSTLNWGGAGATEDICRGIGNRLLASYHWPLWDLRNFFRHLSGNHSGQCVDMPHCIASLLKVVASHIVFTLHQNVQSAASHECRREASCQRGAFRTEHLAGRNCENIEPEPFVGVQALGSGASAGTDWSPAGIEG